MRVAIFRTADGAVENVAVKGEGAWSPPAGRDFVACPAEVGPGWRWTGAAFEPTPVPIAERRAAAVAAIERAFAARIAAGFNHGGVNYQIDPQSQGNITTYGTRASAVLAGVAGAAWPEAFTWIRTDNARQQFTAAQFYAFSQAAQDYVTALYYVRRAIKDAVAVSGNPEAVVEAASWPSN